ncbi:uncharacterized protein LOC128998248 [Macrosteles quadrilineatus]|uniref:uncharacterized protein LOC128984718 n=1 Tax=Macrosteles quadrilineatus TaxID=74068 RepID=UPI0023E319C1|nr:uncharacterized protein LOC128984718 [Macrosteles quadrilineatus]XP_054280274.1 uncharacterized protein LOC128998248 [Macrosteles quadrilineatus]
MGSCKIILGLVFSGIGVCVSFSTFYFFLAANYHAAVWALISGILAAIDFHLLFLHFRRSLSSWHSTSTMKDFEILAVLSLLAGLGAGAWYLFLFFYYQLPVLPISDSYPIASVWAFMTAKWGLGLFITVRHLLHELQTSYPSLLSSPSYIRNRPYYHRLGM